MPPTSKPANQQITKPCVPRHVAIIMDGNGRWAKQRHLPRVAGHREGVKRLQEVLEVAEELGVEIVSVFAFSSENWNRPKKEVTQLMKMFSHFLTHDLKKLEEHNVQLRVVGDIAGFDAPLQMKIRSAVESSKNNTGLKFIVAANYGGQWDIVQAAKQIAEQAVNGEVEIAQVTPEYFGRFLGFGDLPDPDLLIRTSGEIRVSNFFLFQIAYTELYFTDIFWPDFSKEIFKKAIEDYSKRCRRFGKTTEQVALG